MDESSFIEILDSTPGFVHLSLGVMGSASPPNRLTGRYLGTYLGIAQDGQAERLTGYRCVGRGDSFGTFKMWGTRS